MPETFATVADLIMTQKWNNFQILCVKSKKSHLTLESFT